MAMRRSVLPISRYVSSVMSESHSAFRSKTLRRALHGINTEHEKSGTLNKRPHLDNRPSLSDIYPEQETSALESIQYSVRNLELRDLPRVMELKRIQGTHDVASHWETLIKIDPQSIILAENETGEIISVVGLLRHHKDFFFTGFYYVSEKYRRLGLGRKMVSIILNGIGSSNLGLNSAPGIEKYLMKLCDLVILEDRFKCVVNEISGNVNALALNASIPSGLTIQPFQENHLPHIYEYDFSLHGHERKPLLEWSCKERDSQTFVAFRNGACVGFGSVKRSCQNWARVGPLYADDPGAAEAILRSLLLASPRDSRGLAMMTFSTSFFANDLMKKVGCQKVAEYNRLYKKERLEVNTDKVYALTDFNITPY